MGWKKRFGDMHMTDMETKVKEMEDGFISIPLPEDAERYFTATFIKEMDHSEFGDGIKDMVFSTLDIHDDFAHMDIDRIVCEHYVVTSYVHATYDYPAESDGHWEEETTGYDDIECDITPEMTIRDIMDAMLKVVLDDRDFWKEMRELTAPRNSEGEYLD